MKEIIERKAGRFDINLGRGITFFSVIFEGSDGNRFLLTWAQDSGMRLQIEIEFSDANYEKLVDTDLADFPYEEFLRELSSKEDESGEYSEIIEIINEERP